MKIIVLVHKEGREAMNVFSSEGEKLSFSDNSCTEVFWELAKKYPEAVIGWCEEKFCGQLDFGTWEKVFHHDLVMASYAVENSFLPAQIGYVDQLPFINVNRRVRYGTWQMSRDVGGMKGEVILRFKDLLGKIENFEYLLNSIGKLGQQNGLVCYSDPVLINREKSLSVVSTASRTQLFAFIYQHYNSIWTSGLLFCFALFETSFPLGAYVQSFFNRKLFKKDIDLSRITVSSCRPFFGNGIDVIIPTMGRADYLLRVLEDLSVQTLLPVKIVIVEQNGKSGSESELHFLTERQWPFKIIHLFTHKVGVCNARNLALKYTEEDWIFLSDDDQRMEPELMEECLNKLKQYGNSSITTSYLQPGELKKFKIPKQWGTFGSGNSIVHRSFIKRVRFEEIFEYGYGEDVDFGMQLRNIGCDIFYEPSLEIQHLKAPIGGFREEVITPWAGVQPKPKPSPTMMALINKYFTKEQILGYRLELMLRYYSKQTIKNPFKYFKTMKERWQLSESFLEIINANMSLKNVD